MTQKVPTPPSRAVLQAVLRGLAGRCPVCGRGKLFATYITPIPKCASCGEDLSRYQAADFAPYLVTFAIGFVFTPMTFLVVAKFPDRFIPIVVLLLVALGAALALLPRMKGAAIGLLWSLDVQNN